MPRPYSAETTDPRHVIDVRSAEVGDVIEVNPDYLVVRRSADPTTYFIPRASVVTVRCVALRADRLDLDTK